MNGSLKRYDYKCVECSHVHEEDFRESMFLKPCESCDKVTMHKRVFHMPAIKPMMHEHFNQSVGKPISDMHQYREVLKRTSDEHANELGMDVNYQPIDMGDPESMKATGEGIYESNVTRSREGNPLLREIPGEV